MASTLSTKLLPLGIFIVILLIKDTLGLNWAGEICSYGPEPGFQVYCRYGCCDTESVDSDLNEATTFCCSVVWEAFGMACGALMIVTAVISFICTVGEEKCYYGSGLDDYYWCSIGCCYYDSWSSDNDDGVCCEVEGIIVAIWNFLVLAGPGIVLVVAVVVVNFCFPCLEEKCKDLLHRLQSGFDRVCRGIDPIKTFIQKRLDNLGKRLDPVVQYFTKTNRINVMPAASTVQNV